MSGRKNYRALLIGAVSGLALASQAQAQSQSPAQSQAESTGLEEVVVTATRQTDTVNRIPLSIAAVTQTTLDEQGIKLAQDLTKTVPGLTLPSNATNTGVATFGIRGIVATVGSATTGIYLDDTSLTKRSNGGIFQQNGAPVPVLFDLERVEVLKGPQGTLYGGSSQGGTVRFITPTPNLTSYSGMLRIEGSKIKGGDTGYDVGASINGPIVQDKLGFRLSAMRRKTPGWIDAYSPYDGSLLTKDGNGRFESAINAALKWQITDRASATFAVYGTKGHTEGGPGSVTTVYKPDGTPAPANQTFTTPTTYVCTAQFGVLPSNNTTGLDPCPRSGAGAVAPGPNQLFIRPARTYGPFHTGKDDNLVTLGQSRQRGQGVENEFDLAALTLQYDFDHMTVKSITSYVQDQNASGNTGGSEDQGQQQATLEDPLHKSFPLFAFPGPTGVIGDYTGGFRSQNERYGIQQELRFSSAADQRPLNWVGGIYYSNNRSHILYHYDGDSTPSYLAFWGVTATQRYGVGLQPWTNNGTSQSVLDAQIHDNELAAFGEANYYLTEKLKLTAGIRLSRVSLDYNQLNYGQFVQRGPTSVLSTTKGQGSSSPTTPKVGLTYEFTPNDLVYVNASKGFRAGGVNPQVGQAICDVGLTQLGITANEIPPSYDPDTVWSYEAGGKFRLMDNKLQVNGAVYRIDWSGVQATIPISCGYNFVMNGGRARSEGFDLQTQWRPIQPLTLTMNASYTNARYIDAVAGPKPGPGVRPSINAGDGFNIPKWQVSFSAQYNTALTSTIDGYARLDYQWQSDYLNGTSYGTANYNVFTLKADSQDLMNARVGVRFGQVDLNVFANNLLNSRDRIGNAGNGKGACNAATGGPNCTVYTTFTPFVNQSYQKPRTLGAQATYRF
jgi:outer membrane receptor protein involved in Fe transport